MDKRIWEQFSRIKKAPKNYTNITHTSRNEEILNL